MNLNEYEKNVELLNRWARAYYTLDNPIASDEEYDKVYKKIVEFENKNPDKIDESSPTRRVGGVVLEGFTKAKHLKKCGVWKIYLA